MQHGGFNKAQHWRSWLTEELAAEFGGGGTHDLNFFKERNVFRNVKTGKLSRFTDLLAVQ